jgi:xylulokinase
MVYFMGIDVGTQGSRAAVIDEGGSPVASGNGPHTLQSPRPGWSEQDPEEWWGAVKIAVREAGQSIDLKAVRGIGMTGQMHGSVFLDEQDRVIRPALLWNDQRTAAQTDWMTEVAGDQLLRIALNPAITGFQAPKIIWLRDEEPDNYRRVRSVLLPKDFIRFRLTGERATDVSDASGTLLFDVARRSWSPVLLDAFQIPAKWMPEAFEGPDETGRITDAVATELGLPAGTPVAAGGGDNAAAAIGTGIVLPGVVSSSIGSSGVVFAYSERPDPHPEGRLHTMCHSVPGAFHYMGVILAAGLSFHWLREILLENTFGTAVPPGEDAYDVLTGLAGGAPAGAEGLVFLPYLTGERTPHMDPSARAAFVGLTSRHTTAHLARAVMEGITFALRDSLALMRALGLPVERIIATGGGARSSIWRQMQADVLGAPVWRTVAEEGPAYGAALLGAVVGGGYSSVPEAVASGVELLDPIEPRSESAARYDQYFEVYQRLYTDLRAANHRLAELAGDG